MQLHQEIKGVHSCVEYRVVLGVVAVYVCVDLFSPSRMCTILELTTISNKYISLVMGRQQDNNIILETSEAEKMGTSPL